ncbi:hypothetical protein [Chryseobacterium indologenes]|uniref:Uncharacterized protein n=1 Tax=Chryseobacterium indologenes TaxID=253 RepID=A0A0N1KSF3_CHRID|nr:hypothetical protein [Chryseobacterium indologenes]KPE51345.1 hypothetical protein AOB46_09350 [Chryseobacterium indologenes]
MRKSYFGLFITSFLFLLSCGGKEKDTGYTDMLMGIPQSSIDSIRKAEDQKPVYLKKLTFDIDSASSVDLMLPLGNYLKEYSFSSPNINLEDPENPTQVEDDSLLPLGISIKNNLSDGDSGEVLMVGKSDNPNIYSVTDIKKFNPAEKILLEDKNTLIFIDSFGHKKLYYRQYDTASKRYYLYTAETPKYNDEKLEYAALFSAYRKAKNLLAFDKETPSESLTWEKVKSGLSEVELKSYGRYYTSLQKELKYFLKDNDSADIRKPNFDLYLYRDHIHSQKGIDQTKILADSGFSGTFDELPFENRFTDGYFQGKYGYDDKFKFIKRISNSSILVSAEDADHYSYSSPPGYFIISSIKTDKGQFYLISMTNKDGNDIIALMNDYFSKHLKI